MDPLDLTRLQQQISKMKTSDTSVVPGSVQVPENRTRGQKSFRTGPGTARISESVLEQEQEPLKALDKFQNLNCFGMLVPIIKKLVMNRSKKNNIENITV